MNSNNKRLSDAIRFKNYEDAKAALEAGANPNITVLEGGTAALIHCIASKSPIAGLLIEKGADVNAKDFNGCCAVKVALENKSPAIAELLIKKGAKVTGLDDKNEDLLQIAAKQRYENIASLLLKAGVDPNGVNKYAPAPLEYAMKAHSIEIVDLLLNAGAKRGIPPHAELIEELFKDTKTPLGFMAYMVAKFPVRPTMRESMIERLKQYQPPKTRSGLLIEEDGGDEVAQHLLFQHFEALEAIADRFDEKDQPLARLVIYQLATIALANGIERFESSLRVSLEKSLNPLGTQNRPPVSEQLKHLIDNVKLRGFTDFTETSEMVNQCMDTIIFPQFLLDTNMANDPQKLTYVNYRHDIEKTLVSMAAHIMLAGRGLEEIFKVSDEWHIPGNSIPDSLRPLHSHTWQRCFEPIKLKGNLTIEALSSTEELTEESHTLKHCVGRSNYGSRCAAGKVHILSIRKDGIPIATAEITLTKDQNAQDETYILNRVQFQGYKNTSPTYEAIDAYDQFERKIAAGKVSLNKPHNNQWGELPTGHETQHKAFRRIGFVPNQQSIDACVAHFADHLKFKEKTTKRKDTGSFVSDRTEGYRWRNVITNHSAETLLRSYPGLYDQWNELVKNHNHLPAHSPIERF